MPTSTTLSTVKTVDMPVILLCTTMYNVLYNVFSGKYERINRCISIKSIYTL